MKTTSIRCFALAAVAAALWLVPLPSSAQNLYVSLASGTIGEFDANTGAPINASLITGATGAEPLALSGAVIYALSFVNQGTLSAYNVNNGSLIYSVENTGGGILGGSVVSGSDLFFANQNGNVMEYSAPSGALVSSTFVPLGGATALGLAISGNDLYVRTQYGVGEYDATTGAPVAASLVSYSDMADTGLAVSGTDLYVPTQLGVAEYNSMTGASLAPTLVSISNRASGNFGEAALAVSGTNLYVAEPGPGVIALYNANNGNSINPALVNGGSGIAVSPVPEPGTWALLAGGVGLLAGMQRIRRLRGRNGQPFRINIKPHLINT